MFLFIRLLIKLSEELFSSLFKKKLLVFEISENFKNTPLFWNSRSEIYPDIQALSQRKWGQAWGIKIILSPAAGILVNEGQAV